MIPALLPYPLYASAGPCEALACSWRVYRIAACVERSCPHRWQRAEAEDRKARRDKDLRAEGGKPL